MKKILSVLLTLIFVFLCACTAQGTQDRQLSAHIDGLIEETTIEWKDDNTSVVSFDKHAVNNVAVKLKKAVSSPLKIYNGDNIIYEQENNSTYKYCSFSPTQTSSLKLKLDNGKENVESISVYENDNEPDSDFRVTAYILADKIQNIDDLKSYTFDTITDVILFSCVIFNNDGELQFNDSENYSGRKMMKTALKNLKSVIGDRNVNIYVNILGPDADEGISDWKSQMENKAQKHTKAFENDTLAAQINDLLNDYNFNGVFFDYEYPIKAK